MSVRTVTTRGLSHLALFLTTTLACSAAWAEHWTIDGQSLTVEQVVGLTRDESATIALSEGANTQIAQSFDLVMEAALQNSPSMA